MEYLQLNVGQVFYSVNPAKKKYEVVKIDGKGAYFCHFDGLASDIRCVSRTTNKPAFSNMFTQK